MFSLLKYSYEYDDLCEMIIRMICLEPLTHEMCKVLPLYLSKVKDLTIISNLPDENIINLLSRLADIGDYETAFKIIIDNKLDSNFLNLFVNDVIFQNELFNCTYNCKSASSLYIVLYNIIHFNLLQLFEYGVRVFCNELDDKIISSGDVDTIIRCSIYLDKDLFDRIFDSKDKLFKYMLLNDYSSEEIEKVKKIIYTQNDKNTFNDSINEKVSNLKGIFNDEDIAKATELSVEEIEKLRKKFK